MRDSILSLAVSLKRQFLVWIAISAGGLGVSVGVAQDPRSASSASGRAIEFVDTGVETPDYLKQAKAFQENRRCGPNAVFTVLRAEGIEVDYEDVMEQVEVGPQGADMQSLIDCAAHFGLSCSGRKNVSPTDLLKAQMPIIVHMKTLGGKSGNEEDIALNDHFIVIVRHNPRDNTFHAIDTNNLTFTHMTGQLLARSMSGYAIAIDGKVQPATFQAGSTPLIITGLLLLANLGVAGARFRYRKVS